jgi:SAM-dependent methyltransferase
MDTPRAPQDRPAFPEDAVTWLAGPMPRTVVVLGSGEIAAALEAAGHEVTCPPGRPDRLPQPDRSVDLVIAARTLPKDLQDVARVLRTGGQLALVCHDRDQRIPWARKLDRTLGTEVAPDDPTADLVTSGLFGFVSEQSWKWWEIVNTASLEKMVRSELADRPHDDRERRLADAMALYADYGRGADGMQMPWVSRCFKATVVEAAWAAPRALDEEPVTAPRGTDTAAGGDEDPDRTVPINAAVDPVVQDGSDSDLLLIDFR